MTEFDKGGQRGIFHRDNDSREGFFHTYDSLALPDAEPHKVHIFLPNNYESSSIRLPVLYCYDGNTTFWPGGAFGRNWRLSQIISWLWGEGSLQPLMIVAVHPRDREREYTHVEWAPGRAHGGLEANAAWMANGLKPWVDANYRTAPEPHRTTIMGSSHGGLAAFYTAVAHPESFGQCVAYSPSFWVGQSYPRLLVAGTTGMVACGRPHVLDAVKRPASGTPAPRLCIKWGGRTDGGFHNWFVERWAAETSKMTVDTLQKEWGYVLGVNLFAEEDPQGEHSEQTWGRWIPESLKIFYSS